MINRMEIRKNKYALIASLLMVALLALAVGAAKAQGPEAKPLVGPATPTSLAWHIE